MNKINQQSRGFVRQFESRLVAGLISAAVVLLAPQSVSANCSVISGNQAATLDAAFTDHANGTVTHTTTGLMWQKCLQGRLYSGGACTGEAQTYNWQAALKSPTIDGTGGYSDWRVPSRNEVMSLVERACSTPMINTTIFPDVPGAARLWSSTHAGSYLADSAWAVRLDTGVLTFLPKTSPAYVLLVRGGAGDDGYWGHPPPTPDTTPDAFSFVDQTGVTRSTLIESAPITVSGINTATPISVTGGSYQIDAGAWTSTAGNVYNGQQVAVRHTSSASFNSPTNTVLTIGGVSDTFTSTTESIDTTPDAFSFTDQTNVFRSATVVSNQITISGINSAASVTITNGTFEKNGTGSGPWITSTTVVAGDKIRVRHTSSGSYLSTVNTTLTVGGVSDIFSSTTEADPASDTTPDAFFFTDQSNVALSSLMTSNTLTITGLTGTAGVTVSGGEYRVNAGAWTTSPGTITNNQQVTVRHTSSGSFSTPTNTTLTIDVVSDIFTSTTLAADTTPNAFTFTDLTNQPTNTQVQSNAVTILGINTAAPVSVSGGEYQVNGGAWTSASGSVVLNDQVRVRHTTSGAYETATGTVLDVGGVTDTFTSTTEAAPCGTGVWEATSYSNTSGAKDANYTHPNVLTLTDVCPSTAISFTGGSTARFRYSLNGGAQTNGAGTVQPGDVLRLHFVQNNNRATYSVDITIGGVTKTWQHTTN